MFNITEKAKEKLNSLLQEDENKGKEFWLEMKGMGWTGPKLDLVLDEPRDNDNRLVEDGFDFLLSQEVVLRTKLFRMIIIDYADGVYTDGFKIKGGDSSCG